MAQPLECEPGERATGKKERQRRVGGGRKRLAENQPEIVQARQAG
jgi:hypothetical protein